MGPGSRFVPQHIVCSVFFFFVFFLFTAELSAIDSASHQHSSLFFINNHMPASYTVDFLLIKCSKLCVEQLI